MTPPSTIPGNVASVTQQPPRNVPASPVIRDIVLAAVGRQRKAIPLKAARVAKVVGHSTTTESMIRSGERMSPTGRAALAIHEAVTTEAAPLERAAEMAAYVEAILRTVAMIPELSKLTTADLYRELREEIVRCETRANSMCNDLEGDFLLTNELPAGRLQGLLDGHTKQGAASIRIAAILQVLADRMDR